MHGRRADRMRASAGSRPLSVLATFALLAGLASAPLAAAARTSSSAATRTRGADRTTQPASAAGATTGSGTGCPAASGSSAPASPTVGYPAPAVIVEAPGVTVKAVVDAHGRPASVFVRFGESPGYARCSATVHLPGSRGRVPVSMPLVALIPRATYHYEVGASTAEGTTYGRAETFIAPVARIAPGVTIGPLKLGGATPRQAVELLDRFLAAPLRFTFEDVYWSAPRARLGAEIDAARTIAAALAAPPGAHLRLELTIDPRRLRLYLQGVNNRFAHPASAFSVRLVGTRAVVARSRPPVAVDMTRMTAAVRTALDSGLDERVRLLLEPSAGSVPVAKAVVVRLASQTLTAYLNGKAVLRTPVTTGRPALPTPVGSYKVIFRASPFVFHSPWPEGSPYWYPPTPVTWAMDFYGGDFLHDDPGEPSDAFGTGSEDGPYASHGCVHVPHDVMAFLYRWLPIGSQVVVSEN